MINKKGNAMGLIYFFIILFVILFAGFVMITGSAVINWVFDEAVPELTELGMVDETSTNLTEIADYTIDPLNSIVQAFTWLTGVLFIMMLTASIGVVFVFRVSPSKWLIGFYFALVLILILGSMFISNIYEEFSTGDDELATRLQEHTLLNYMLLYSPAIFTILAFIIGIILFSGMMEEEQFA